MITQELYLVKLTPVHPGRPNLIITTPGRQTVVQCFLVRVLRCELNIDQSFFLPPQMNPNMYPQIPALPIMQELIASNEIAD
jgi:hypothetical protein